MATTLTSDDVRATILEGDAVDLSELPLYTLANIVLADWRKPDGTQNIWFGAVPYLQAMFSLSSVDDSYGADSGKSVVIYFVSNAAQWRGPVARAVKAELKRRIK
jgi:hypothetical protein